MSPAEVLALAADKLEVGWTTGTSARDSDGVAVMYRSSSACAWCSSGAIWAAAPTWAPDATRAYSDYLSQRFGVRSVTIWNDHHCPDQATAVATMRAAAESLKTSTKEPR